MKSPDNINKELKEVSPLISTIKNDNVYSVPPFYFNNLAEKIIEIIKLFGRLPYNSYSVNPYTVKEGYFESLAESVLRKIQSEEKELNEVTHELESFAPILNTINKRPVFKLPEGYFESFTIASSKTEKPAAKVAYLRKIFSRYAVAAIIAMLMAVGTFYIIGKNTREPGNQALNVKSALKGLEDDEIIEFLQTHATAGDVTTATSEKKNSENKIHKRLKEMSEKDIQQYLQENLEPEEIELDI
jgi:hypothetical protein